MSSTIKPKQHPRPTLLLAFALLGLAGCDVDGPDEASGEACNACPEMVTVEAGSFLLGSPPDEAGHVEDEGPQKRVELATFAVSRFEITGGAFRTFVEETDYRDDAGCYTMAESGTWGFDAQASWQDPGFAQDEHHPVVCVTWGAANAYVTWLNEQETNGSYRLLSESEWEYSARGGASTPYWWGVDEEEFCRHTNGVDRTAHARYPGWVRAGQCDDGFLYTAPVGTFASPNGFGIEDMVGNVWEWVADCYVDHYGDHPDDGSAIDSASCDKRVMRGGAWGDYGSFYLRTAYRGAWDGAEAFANIGFRVAMTLTGRH